jgi:hypothetical protein
LDNIGEGLKKFQRMAAEWDEIFPTLEISKRKEGAGSNKPHDFTSTFFVCPIFTATRSPEFE